MRRLFWQVLSLYRKVYILHTESAQDKTHKMGCAPSEDSDQPRHPPSLISSISAWKLGLLTTHWAHSIDWSDWADARPDSSESSLDVHVILLVLSCAGSNQVNVKLSHWINVITFVYKVKRKQNYVPLSVAVSSENSLYHYENTPI